MAITAALVKELREMTGAGMMDAKKALVESDGNMDAAVDWLRAKGLGKAAKKSGRTAAEGLVAVKVAGSTGVAVEVNSETDFVARNAEFQEMVGKIAEAATTVSDVEALKTADLGGKSVADTLTDKIATIGENMSLRRMVTVEGDGVVSYVHNAAGDGMGQIGVLVAYSGDNSDVARQVAMHIAAMSPIALNEEGVDQSVRDKEKAVFVAQAQEAGKSEAGVESWSDKQVAKFIKESTLLNQKFVVDSGKTVAAATKDAGITITAFARVERGEGIEKSDDED